jgi:RNA polymerase sigma factor (sigma-70 family)
LLADLKSRTIEFVPDSRLAKQSYAEMLSHLENLADVKPERRTNLPRPPRGLPAYLASLYETPLLTAEGERHLFTRMNALKQVASAFRDRLNVPRPSATTAAEVVRLLDAASQLRNQIVQANLRLVVSIAKKFADPLNSFDELVSEGNMPLLRAIELFDVRRGFRFSTYATWAIRNHLRRFISDRARLRRKYVMADDDMPSGRNDADAARPADAESRYLRQQNTLQSLFRKLPEREQFIVRARFGLNERREPNTLAEIGRELGISKERVRQLALLAVAKLRRLVSLGAGAADLKGLL